PADYARIVVELGDTGESRSLPNDESEVLLAYDRTSSVRGLSSTLKLLAPALTQQQIQKLEPIYGRGNSVAMDDRGVLLYPPTGGGRWLGGKPKPQAGLHAWAVEAMRESLSGKPHSTLLFHKDWSTPEVAAAFPLLADEHSASEAEAPKRIEQSLQAGEHPALCFHGHWYEVTGL